MKAKIGGKRVELSIESRVAALGTSKNASTTNAVASGEAIIEKVIGNAVSPLNSPYRSKLEAAFARVLELDRLDGVSHGFQYEPMNIRLSSGDKNFYKPDFLVWSRDNPPTFYEVKGRNKSDDRSLVKMKVAASLHPWARFILVKRRRGIWVEREINPR